MNYNGTYELDGISSIRYEHFVSLLDDFSYQVNEKIYQKLDYKMWRDLRKIRYNYPMVYLKWDDPKCHIIFTGEDTIHCVVDQDNSFGEYLFDHHDRIVAFSEEGNMPTKNDNTAPNFWEDALTSATSSASNATDWNYISTDRTNVLNTPAYDKYGLTIGSGWNDTSIEICGGLDQKADKIVVDAMDARIRHFKKEMETKNENAKEKEDMKFNFDFGPVDSNSVRMSMYGLAIKNRDGVWVSYDSTGKQVMDVDVLNFDGAKFMYKMPVAVKDIKSGDVIVHNRKPMFVTEITKAGIAAMDIYEGELKVIVPTVNMFGFNFVTKIVSLVNFGTPTADQPFGNMLPFMLMNEGKNDKNSMLMMAMAMNGGMNANMMSNPLMMIALMGDKDIDTGMLMYLAMQNQNAHSCNCGNHNHGVEHKCHGHGNGSNCGEHACHGHGNNGCCDNADGK